MSTFSSAFSLSGTFKRATAARTYITPVLWAAITCLGASQASLAADAKSTAAHPSAAQIVEKNIAARGGLPAWHAVQSMSWAGKMDAGSGDSAARSARFLRDSAAKNAKKALATLASDNAKEDADKQVQLPFTLQMERPLKSRLELQFAGKTAVQVYDGTSGWKVRPFLNRNDVEPFSTQEAKLAADKPGLDGPLIDYAAKGTKVEFEAVEPVEGHAAYKLKLTAKSGTVQHIWIDAQSFLDVKVEGSQRHMDGRMRNVFVYQRDFRSVQGIMIPYLLETAVDGYRDTHKIIIEKVTVNPKLDDAAFGKPRA
jgi:outer membrane lipoprotein-sorting protein